MISINAPVKKQPLSDMNFFTELPKYLGARILNQTTYMWFLDTKKPEKIVTSLLFTILDSKLTCNLKNFDFFMPAFHSKVDASRNTFTVNAIITPQKHFSILDKHSHRLNL